MRPDLKGAIRQVALLLLSATVGLAGEGCTTTTDWLASSGPGRRQISSLQENVGPTPIRVVTVTGSVATRILSSERRQYFSEGLSAPGSHSILRYVVGPGDVLEISIWEAPPAALFGSAAYDPRSGVATSRVTTLPEEMVTADGVVTIPFAGSVMVAQKTPEEIARQIELRLAGKANQPQVLVRIIRNNTEYVTVVGEVAQSLRMPLTPKGERLLDALAAAGGVRQPVGKITIQITRGTLVYAMPLERVIEDPTENIPLAPGDVVTALFQSQSFSVLGAAGKNEEVPFEAQGISLGQALARAGGVQDAMADARGVFLFRFEDPAAMDEVLQAGPKAPDGKVPVVYRIDLKDPGSFLVAQNFPMRDKDIIYVAEAPSAELQKFLNILTSSIYSVYTLLHP